MLLDEPPAEQPFLSGASARRELHPPATCRFEGSVEQSATPWRVFDAPANENEPAGAGPVPAPRPGAAGAAVGPGPGTRVAVLGLIGAIVVGAIAVVVALGGSGGQLIDGPAAGPVGSGGTAMLAGGGDLVVDVTGAVARPGLYRLPAGSRVGDAIDAAGGFSPRVDAGKVQEMLNLASTVTDGSQVHVPSRDDPDAAAVGDGGAGGAGGGAGSGGAGGSGLVDLNTATPSELDTLPGIGPVTAAKIVESRSAAPFTTIEELRDRKLVGEKTFDQLKSLVTVR
jgi:competence protein ComEA